ncbi:hypothetical protein [Cupriavidus taiwanensis]|uniref:hypothetical protein n=1 Tax=Cupriavidus taiwanensis TaxID=164546 RepID=UPI003D6637F5
MRRAGVVAVRLGVRQEDRHAPAGLDGDVLDLQPAQFVRPEAPPEANQHQGLVARQDLEVVVIACHRGRSNLGVEPHHQLLELSELQRLGAPLLCGVQCLDALEHLPHVWRPVRIWEALRDVPLCDCSQALTQGVDR